MPRSSRSVRAAPPTTPADPRLVHEDLRAWAGEAVARSGRHEALLGRVELLRIAPDGRSLEARVRGNRALPYHVQVVAEAEQLLSTCSCGRDARPACKHAVAALEALRFPVPLLEPGGARRTPRGRRARGRGRITRHVDSGPGTLLIGGPERILTRDERLALARDEELALRRRARRQRAEVRRLAGAGPLRLAVGDGRRAPGHEVVLRGPDAEHAACTCQDFAENELLTCRHVERALSWFARHGGPLAAGWLSVWWRPRVWLDARPDPLQEIRLDLPSGAPPAGGLAPWFDESGWLRALPLGCSPRDWADAGFAAAAALAAGSGWQLDIDSLCRERVEAAEREAWRATALESIAPDGAAWQAIVPRLGYQLHAYQEQGALFLARRGRALLADAMGLGKTVQAITAALLLRREVGAQKALVICPASLKHQWRREIERACGERPQVIDAPRAARLAAYAAWREGFLILNYELILRDLEALRATQPDLVVLDEAQRIKNWDTRTARAVKALASPHAFILTGTPLENRLLELHSLAEYLHPRALGPRWRLFPFHAVTGRQGRVLAYEGLEVLRRRLSDFFLRRERRAVLDQLPPRTENTYWTGMTLAQRRPYRKYAGAVAALVARGVPLGPAETRRLLQALTSMRVLCNARAQYLFESVAERLARPEAPSQAEIAALHSPKLEEFARVLEELLDGSDEKIVVFSQWERTLRLAHFVVRAVLESRDLRAGVFHGGLSGRARDAMLEAFRLDPDFRLLLSTDAGGLGLNLQHASIVVNLEVPWNPAVLDQRVGRIDRLGQRQSVQILHFVTRDSIEERVRQVLDAKRALFDGLLRAEADTVVLGEAERATLASQVKALLEEP